jgi:hypothetical protein
MGPATEASGYNTYEIDPIADRYGFGDGAACG